MLDGYFSGVPPHGQPMEFHWLFLMCIPWASSMANALGPHLHGISMELHWEFSWGMAWLPSMCMPVGICPYPCYGLALVLPIGGMPRKCLMGTSVGCHPMGSPWNTIGYSLCAFHGLLLWVMHWDHPMGFLWNCMGSSHGEWHGILLCAVHWAFAHIHVMDLHWSFP